MKVFLSNQSPLFSLFVLSGLIGVFVVPASADPGPGNDAAETARDAARDRRALDFWLENGKPQLDKLRELGKGAQGEDGEDLQKVRFIVHLPSGKVAFPSPAAVTEGTLLQMVVISPSGTSDTSQTSLRVDDCSDYNSFRTTLDGSAAAADEETNAKSIERGLRDDLSQIPELPPASVPPLAKMFAKVIVESTGPGDITLDDVSSAKSLLPGSQPSAPSLSPEVEAEVNAAVKEWKDRVDAERQASRDQAAQESFRLLPVGPYFRCGAGPLKYQMEWASAESESVSVSGHMRVRPKYHLAAIAMLGFDFAERTTYDKQMREPADPLMSPSSTIVSTTDRVGASAYVGAVWMVGGVDYEDMQPWNYVLNPFLAVSASSPTEDMAMGLALTPTGGVSLALGLSLHRGQELRGYEVGDVFTGDGDLPTRETWRSVKPGFIAGLAVDSRIYDALVKRFGGQ